MSSNNPPANSPPSADCDDKRQCVLEESFIDPDATTVSPEVLSSTVMERPESPQTPGRVDMASNSSSSIRDELKAALCDPGVLDLISGAVVGRLQKEIAALKDDLAKQDREIMLLKDQVYSLEQYSRWNCVRIGPIPELANEDTDEIVKKVAAEIGVNLTVDAIDPSHRVGKKPTESQTYDRSIIVKFTS